MKYSPTAGKSWSLHGRYMQRADSCPDRCGYGSDGDHIDCERKLGQWQREGDKRVFQIVVSPEDGRTMDLTTLTRNLVSEMERDFGTRLEWVATTHENTNTRHVHLAIRGINDKGRELRIPRDYVRSTMRARAMECATNQAGYRRKPPEREHSRERERGRDRQIGRSR